MGARTAGWLRLVLVQTVALAAVQLVAAWRSRSLAILGDTLHVVLDIVAYAVALAMETWKARTRDPQRLAAVDLAASLLSIVVVLFSSTAVCEQAMGRLSTLALGPSTSVVQTGMSDWWRQFIVMQDFADLPFRPNASATAVRINASPARAPPLTEEVDGSWMLGFAILSTGINTYLAWAGMHACSHSLSGCENGACNHNHTFDLFGQKKEKLCVPEAPSAPSGWLPQIEQNLNAWTQLVHVTMDAVRGVVLLVCSALIWAGLVNGTFLDAALSLAVTAMVVLGSLGLLPQAFAQLRVVCAARDDLSARSSEQWDCEEAASLLNGGAKK